MSEREWSLHEIIADRIRREGPIPFDLFMEMALYWPRLGYYTRKETVIGQKGDFFTASHLGNVFGLLVARQIERLWRELESPSPFTITEVGPGMGFLSGDILDTLSETSLYEVLHYRLVEINPWLQRAQRERLRQHSDKLRWYTSVNDLSPAVGVCLCNEILDALSVRLFELRGEPMEVFVTLDDYHAFTEHLVPCRDDTLDYLREFAPWVLSMSPYRSEVHLGAKSWLCDVCRTITTGYLVIVDYGYPADEYYDPARNRGTLLCYHHHSVHDNPYLHVGEQDITAHVNFTAIERWAEEIGFRTIYHSSQGRYLLALSDEAFLEELYRRDPSLILQFKRLILPSGMGTSHHVMILASP